MKRKLVLPTQIDAKDVVRVLSTATSVDEVRARYPLVTLAPTRPTDDEEARFCHYVACEVLGLGDCGDMTTCSGHILKRYAFVALCHDPEGASKWLALCDDDTQYAFLRPRYLGESLRAPYLCDPNAQLLEEEDEGRVARPRIQNAAASLWWRDLYYPSFPLKDVVSYVITPDGKLLFGLVAHHSTFTCGQPVLCAGNLTSYRDGEEYTVHIDAESGHYMPSDTQLFAGLTRVWRSEWPVLERFVSSAAFSWKKVTPPP